MESNRKKSVTYGVGHSHRAAEACNPIPGIHAWKKVLVLKQNGAAECGSVSAQCFSCRRSLVEQGATSSSCLQEQLGSQKISRISRIH
jgi:hypothetical protein